MGTQKKSGKAINIILWVLIVVFMFLSVFSYTKELKAKENYEQKYIVRYGKIISETEILTEDGNLWYGEDFPEERYIRILFDSRETTSVEDDIIIDITEDTREVK